MTREEATVYWKQRSKHIHNWLEENEDVDFIGEYVEAIDMAIDALSVPQTDLISRTKLFNKLATVQAPPEANEYKAEVYKIIQSMGTEADMRGDNNG